MADSLLSPTGAIEDDDISSTGTASTDDSLIKIPYKILDGEKRNPQFPTFDFPFTFISLSGSYAILESLQFHELYIEELYHTVYYGLKDLARKNLTLTNTVLKNAKHPRFAIEDTTTSASAKKPGVKGGKVGKGKGKVGAKGKGKWKGKAGEFDEDEEPVPKGAMRKWGREMGNLIKKIEGWEGELEGLGNMVKGSIELSRGRGWGGTH
ncbi:MAG: hypothetical protein L6R37_007455 [Teloschistes peruensis]|nr:MAG: hypothetical protein L6R37_007455 [Teloschistes peruensis]